MKNLWPQGLAWLVLALVLSAFSTGCSQNESDQHPQTALRDLVRQDLQKMAAADEASITSDDERTRSLFAEIFGGTDGRSLRNYVDTRISYYFTEEELENGASVSPSPVNTQYTSSAILMDQKAVKGASNVGMGIWFQGAIDRNVVTLTVPATGQSIVVDSPRTGIMEIGPGYQYKGETADGGEFVIPTEYRQAILIHEARHSDCTGGVTEADLDVARHARNIYEFTNQYPKLSCGHMHVFCPLVASICGAPCM